VGGNGSLGAIVVNSGGFLAPGFGGTGTLTSGSNTWNPGGAMRWQLNDIAGVAGGTSGWDLLNINGALTINATASSPFLIALESLNGSAFGNAANFNPATFYSWQMVTTTGGIYGFEPAAFSEITTGIAGQTGVFSNALAGSFSVSQAGNDLYLNYTPTAVPEPGACALLAGLGGLGFAAWRRRRP
jgi:hypothetical protein